MLWINRDTPAILSERNAHMLHCTEQMIGLIYIIKVLYVNIRTYHCYSRMLYHLSIYLYKPC